MWDTGWMGHVLLEKNKNVDDLGDLVFTKRN